MANGDLVVVEALRLLFHKTLVSFTDVPKMQTLTPLRSQKNGGFRRLHNWILQPVKRGILKLYSLMFQTLVL
jgi:hypothetical protein